MSKLVNSICLRDSTHSCVSSTQVAKGKQNLLAHALSCSGVPQPHKDAYLTLPRGRVGPAGPNPNCPLSKLNFGEESTVGPL